MRVAAILALSGALTFVPAAVTVTAAGAPLPETAAPTGHVAIVQAVPGATVDVMIDGEAVESSVAAGEVLGPYRLSAGQHRVDFSGAGDVTQAATVEVKAGSEQDLVLHRPASVGAEAVVTTYSTPDEPIGPGKARVLVAHTATVAPADVKVDGQVVFANIANGEFATADVPAGKHVVALLPTGETTDPILGPLTVELVPQTVTMVYAMGDPEQDTMELVAHSARLAADGSLVPSMIGTGSAGLAADVRVTPFGGPS